MYVLDTNAFYYASGISECTYDVEKLKKLIDDNEIFISSTTLFEFLPKYRNDITTIDDINSDDVAYFQKMAVANKRMAKEAVSDDIQAVLENLNLVNDEGKIKKAALLLFGKHPDKFVSAPYFRIGRFRKDF